MIQRFLSLREAAVSGHGAADDGGFTRPDQVGAGAACADAVVAQAGASDAEFRREWERHYLLAVRSAALEVMRSSAWLSESEARLALAEALRRRGVYAEEEAVRAGAALLSRGRRPRILDLDLDAVGGRRRRH